MKYAYRIIGATVLLAGSLALTSCSGIHFTPGSAANPAASANPTQTTSTSLEKVVLVNGEKYKVLTTTNVLTWQKKDGSFGADTQYVASVVNRDGDTLYTRKVFDDSAWFTLLGKWTIDQPDYKNLSALKSAIVDAS